MSDEELSEGWGKEPDTNQIDIDSIPNTWAGYTKQSKIDFIVNVILNSLQAVAIGNFKTNKAEKVAALALMAQMEMSSFYSDSEFDAKHAKHLAEYEEEEKALEIKDDANKQGLKLSETALKRSSLISDNVKGARQIMVEKERDFKKWKYLFETMGSAHHYFKNLGRVL